MSAPTIQRGCPSVLCAYLVLRALARLTQLPDSNAPAVGGAMPDVAQPSADVAAPSMDGSAPKPTGGFADLSTRNVNVAGGVPSAPETSAAVPRMDVPSVAAPSMPTVGAPSASTTAADLPAVDVPGGSLSTGTT